MTDEEKQDAEDRAYLENAVDHYKRRSGGGRNFFRYPMTNEDKADILDRCEKNGTSYELEKKRWSGRKYKETHPEGSRDRSYKFNHGVSLEWFRSEVANRGGRCFTPT